MTVRPTLKRMENTNMDKAYIRFCHDLEDGWYQMREPTGANDSWGVCKNAVNFCKEKGWTPVWEGDDMYKPKDFPETVA